MSVTVWFSDGCRPDYRWFQTFALLTVTCTLIGCQSESFPDPVDLEALGARLVKNDEGQIVLARMLNLDLDDTQASALGGIATLEEVSIQECDAITGSCLKEIAALPNLRSLRLLLSPITDANLAHVSQAVGLEEFKLTDVPISNDGLEIIAGCKQLRSVALTNLQISDAALQHLQALPNLETLSLQECSKIDGPGLDHLQETDTLTSLDVTGTSVLKNGVTHLAHHPQLRELRFDPEECTDQVAATLAQVVSLEGLVLVGAPLTDIGLAHVAKLESLKKLELTGCGGITVEGLASFRGHPTLELIDLGRCRNMSDDCVAPISAIPNLKVVHLNDTRFTKAGARALKDALPNCTIVFGAEPNTEQL